MKLVLFATSLGVLLVPHAGWVPGFPHVLGLLIPAVLIGWFRNTPADRILMGFLIGFVAGSVLLTARLDRQLTVEPGTTCQSEWHVQGIPRTSSYPYGSSIRFAAIVRSHCLDGPRMIDVRWFIYRDQRKPKVSPGQLWQGKLDLERTRGWINPGTFDYETWLFARGFDGRGIVRGDPVQRPGSRNDLSLIRHGIAQWIERWFADSEVRGLMVALAIGDGHDVSPAHWDMLIRSGTIHLVIISGLHLGLVYGFVLLVCRWSPMGHRTTIALGFFCAMGYALLAGFGVPVQRALAMVGVLALTAIKARYLSNVSRWCVALLVVALMDPMLSFSKGAWLSFTAVLCLILALGGQIHEPPVATSGASSPVSFSKWVRQVLDAQFVIFVGLAPLLVLQNHYLSPVAFAINIAAIPWISLLTVPAMLLGVVSLVIEPIEPIPAYFMMWIAERSLQVFSACLAGVGELPMLQPAGQVHWSGWLFLIAGSLVALIPRGTRLRWLAVPCLVPMFAGTPSGTDESLYIRILDVGQGLAVTIDTPSGLVVYDTGIGPVGEQVIYPTLARMGHRKIDVLVISHNDDDHAGGLSTLSKRIPIVATYRAGCSERKWQMGHVRMQLLSAGNDQPRHNDASCVLVVSMDSFRMLIPGDVEEAGERYLRSTLAQGMSVLVSPHHGSRTSSSPGFLNHFMPETVVVASGYGNRFGHPHPEILDRYHRRGMQVYNTAYHGAVDITVARTGHHTVRLARSKRQYPWHQKSG